MLQKGPGKWFRKGISLVEVGRLFPDDPTAEEWFAAMRWPDGAQCPHCASRNVLSGAAHPSMSYRCRGCDKRFSVRTGSVMADSKLGYQVWAIAIYLLTTGLQGVSSMKLHRDLGISQKSAWHLAHRIRRSWEPWQGLFAGPGGGGRDLYRGQGRQQAREPQAARRAGDGGQDAGGWRAGPEHARGGASVFLAKRKSYESATSVGVLEVGDHSRALTRVSSLRMTAMRCKGSHYFGGW